MQNIFTLDIKMNNAAFDEDPLEEIARILNTTADKIRHGSSAGTTRDMNGNMVGNYGIG